MRDDFELDDELTRRLRSLGTFPIDSATQSRHLTAMAEAAAAPRLMATFGQRLRVAAALVIGFMLGTTGLASAGALGPMQPIAATAIEAATPFSVPGGHEDDAGTPRYREGCDESVTFKNRGSYLKAVRAKYGKESAELEAAKASDCGKPLVSLGGDDEATENDQSEEKKADSDNGKPENPGKSADAKGQKTSEEGAEAGKANAACANGAAGNGTDPATGADVASDAVEPSENEPVPTTGPPACAEEQKTLGGANAADEAKPEGDTADDDGDGTGKGKDNHPDGVGNDKTEEDAGTPAGS
jgi:hypothetical protein